MKSDRVLKTDLKALKFELLVPANNKDTAFSAIKAGADAVYIGYSKYGARVQAGNSIEDIIDVIEFAHKYRVKIYVTLNTILKDEELPKIEKLIWKLYKIKTDGIIIQDMGILKCKLPPVNIIASTQCHNNSVEKIQFLEKTGFKRVILPRELSLEEIKEIKQKTNIALECFIHGALCVSYSGQCYLSYAIGKRSANRGECAQPCRKKYSLYDADNKCIVRDKHLLSLKDLNLSSKLEDLILNGVTSFKIEGRLKNKAYVINTTAYYRRAIDKVLNNYGLKRSSSGISTINFEPDLNKTFNRGYTDFNIQGDKKDLATMDYVGSLGEYIGVVDSVKKNSFSLKQNILNNGDGICFFNDDKELIGTNINKTEGDLVFPSSIKGIKSGVKIYRNYNKEFDDSLNINEPVRKIPVKIKVTENEFFYNFFMTDEENNTACYLLNKNFEIANNKEKAKQTIEVQLSKLGETEFFASDVKLNITDYPFFRVSILNEIRRNLVSHLIKLRAKNYKYAKSKPIEKVEYPEKILNYKANIYNDKAKEFYKERGCIIEEMALEAQKDCQNKELMVSKYCIKKQLGMCSKQPHINKYKEPFIIKDEFNKAYFVEFDCKDCVMKIRSKI